MTDRVATVRAVIAGAMTLAEAARRHGVSVETVRKWRARVLRGDLRLYRTSGEARRILDVAEARKMREAGATYAQIGDRWGVTYQAAHKALRA